MMIFGVSLFVASTGLCDDSPRRDFTLKILPLLKEKCLGCHGEQPDDLKGDFDVRSLEALLIGGESGDAAVVPGKPEQGTLISAIRWNGLEMPPKENDRLTPEQVNLFERWIAAGAPWPDAAEQKSLREAEWSVMSNEDGEIFTTSGGLADQWTYRRYQPDDVWAFKPVKKLTIDDLRFPTAEGGSAKPADLQFYNQPSSINSRQSEHPIDVAIRARLASAGFEPAPPADPRVLIRRATLDLIGLVPTPDEIANFEQEWLRDSLLAWSNLVDRLLNSAHYGERWGQHWFDVTRYADTGGMANDFERSNMWRYRDWVIRSLNDDKPYDQFVREQLAGDQLADLAALARLGGDESKLAALRQNGDYTEEEACMILGTGFLRMGPWDNAMISDPESRQIYLDDLVNSVGQTFLATTLRCVKCHDHKFDPIPTRDYYRLYAALAGTQMAERPLRFIAEENRDRFDTEKAHVERMLAFAKQEKNRLVDKREAAARAWYEEHKLPYKDEENRRNDPDEMKPPRHTGLDHVDAGQLKVREQDDWIWERILERFEPLVQGVYDGPDPKYTFKSARSLRMPKTLDVTWKPKSFIYNGGALTAPGEEVGPGVLSAIGVSVASSARDPYALPEPISERRLALANWIADSRNPLTTRAIVNRVWEYHFGKPLAGNPNNFGAKGRKPTHPELLDWLTNDFVEHGWTLKRLHKLIMLSDTYKMSATHAHHDELRQSDPSNALLAYFPTRRLTAEELRDVMLAVTGELNPSLGGLPAMPEINMEVALQPRMIQFSLAPSYQPSRTPEERNRRSIYAYRVRGQADPFLEVFNQPNPNESCEFRDSAAVSPQAFTLLNSDLMTDRSIAFALRVQHEVTTTDQQIDRAFQLALGRLPSAAERNRLGQYRTEMVSYHEGVEPDEISYPTKITQSLVEEFSGKKFEYEEILPVFENYMPDKKATDVTPETRALADVCLLLFNCSEFLYVK